MKKKCGTARVYLERNQLVQFDRYRLFKAPRISICYLEQSHKIMPLESIDYHIRIQQGLAVVEMIQVYKNTLEIPQQVNYLQSIQPNAVFTKMEIQFGEKRLLGVVKEKSIAKQEFNQGVAEGKTMVYSEKDDEFPDIMRVKLGNLAPKATLKITFEYAQPLEVCVNKFWKISIEPIVSPRYHLNKNNNSLIDYVNRIVDISSVSTDYKQNIAIEIDMGTPITFIKSPTHELINLDAKNDNQAKSNKTQLILDQNQNSNPSKTFVLLLANEMIHQPTAILTHTNDDALAHQKYCATISFIPQFNKLPLDDAYSAFLDQQDLESEKFDFPQRGEYIFLIDRSGSMDGSRIEKAKEALTLFVKSLPTDSYFNIVSFGSSFQKLYSESKKYNSQSMEEAVSEIDKMRADFGGTEILSPFQDDIYKQKEIPDYPRNIFLLTDGEVTPDPVVDIVRKNCKPSVKVYTIGIGNGCSKFLVEKVAAVGNGKCQFISDNENMTAKVIDLLQDSVTPYLQSFKMESSVIDTFSVVPNPEILQSLKKNTPFTMQFLFPQQPDDVKMIKFSFECFDPQLKQKMGCEIELDIAQSKDLPYFHKLAAYKQITAIEDACKFRDEFVNGCLINRPAIKLEDIVEISVQHQILSRATAFICEVAELEDNWKQLIKNKYQIQQPAPPERQFEGMMGMKMNPQPPMMAQMYMPQMQMCSAPPQCYARAPQMNCGMASPQCYGMGSQIKYQMAPPQCPIIGNAPPPPPAPQYQQMNKMPPPGMFNFQAQMVMPINQNDIKNLNLKKMKLFDEEEQEDEQQNKDYRDIIKYSQADGSFRCDENLKTILKLDKIDNIEQIPEDCWICIIALLYLELYCIDERESWSLIFQKSIQFLKESKYNYQEIKSKISKEYQKIKL